MSATIDAKKLAPFFAATALFHLASVAPRFDVIALAMAWGPVLVGLVAERFAAVSPAEAPRASPP